jgi:hypothetical protein
MHHRSVVRLIRERIGLSSATGLKNFGPFRLWQSTSARMAAIAIGLLFGSCFPLVAHAASPADLISNYRLEHGEGKVKVDPALDRIAREQAEAMAAKDLLDHDALRPFGSRVAVYGPTRSAENIAYGYDTFPKTLDQWIASSGHRYNLLLHNASRVGVASAKSSKSGRTYWAMVIAVAVEKPKHIKHAKGGDRSGESCRIMLNDVCL